MTSDVFCSLCTLLTLYTLNRCCAFCVLSKLQQKYLQFNVSFRRFFILDNRQQHVDLHCRRTQYDKSKICNVTLIFLVPPPFPLSPFFPFSPFFSSNKALLTTLITNFTSMMMIGHKDDDDMRLTPPLFFPQLCELSQTGWSLVPSSDQQTSGLAYYQTSGQVDQ